MWFLRVELEAGGGNFREGDVVLFKKDLFFLLVIIVSWVVIVEI